MSAKSKKTVGLGKSLIRNRFQTTAQSGLRMKVNPDGSSVKHTTEVDESTRDWSRMQSITQENDLDAFLSTATLAGTEFTAEKLNVQVITKDQKNPFLLSADEERQTLKLHKEHRSLLTVPRRPVWDGIASPEIQKHRERESFLEWRRGLVELEEEKGLLMTPYERNIEVWRQLWRVIEKSDLVIQIVDARNPTLFRSVDLESYVRQVDNKKKNLLLINKADMLTVRQREAWASYFEREGVEYVFFSAALAKRRMEEAAEAAAAEVERAEWEEKEKRVRKEISEMGIGVTIENRKGALKSKASSMFAALEDLNLDEGTDASSGVPEEDHFEDPAIIERISDEEVSNMSNESPAVQKREPNDHCDELLELIAKRCPQPLRPGEKKTTIGFVGYPNVGKSSTLNALVGAKKVTVSSTPGKTKHFQTIHLDDQTILCDCPGLVFPSFATTKAEMVVNGVLPIDQLREHTGPATLVAQRIPRHALSAIYGIKIRTFDEEGNLDSSVPVKGEQLCAAYAVNRGFKKAGQGNPDEARAARIILKDYVLGKLLFCHPPPGDYDPVEFNIETYSGEEFFPKKKRAQTHEVAGETADAISVSAVGSDDSESDDDAPDNLTAADEANVNRSLDSTFFKTAKSTSGASMKGKFQSSGFTRTQLYPHQVSALASAGESLVVRTKVKGKERSVQLPTAPAGMGLVGTGGGSVDPASKKHKKTKRGKVRVNWTKDERCD
ncbi:hypothetical protein HDU84_003186 [Entophlyctis sp. JEL0112]|nr:hypothetical protein HDU84_003186 [Entophlyctis sp. JEL0112]